ncbi:MAG: type VI secretion system contractile sheath small subunit [Sandaracinaceae bacterium]
MGRDTSVAPKERVNITYRPATGDAQEEVELPLRILMLGDYAGRDDDTPIEERRPLNVDKDNFGEVLAAQDLRLDLSVEDRLSGTPEGERDVRLRFATLADFTPEGIAAQVPELQTPGCGTRSAR